MELAIEHVGNHRKRMPVGRNGVAEGPGHPVPRETYGYLRVLRDVFRVVVVNEVVSERLPENKPDNSRENDADSPNLPVGCIWIVPSEKHGLLIRTQLQQSSLK